LNGNCKNANAYAASRLVTTTPTVTTMLTNMLFNSSRPRSP
jgi:hypothetical protein